MNLPDRCWVEVESAALRDNIESLRQFLLPQVKIASVIKADAYGHGLEAIAQLIADKVDLLGVANLAEARRARAAGVDLPVMILGPALPEERTGIVDHRFIPTVSTAEEASGYAAATKEAPLPIHFVIDTGMGRIGLWEEEALAEFQLIRAMKQLRVEAISTHLPVADEDPDYTKHQLERIRAQIEKLSPESTTVLNSAGILRFGSFAQPGDIVRAGLTLYGISPVPEFQSRFRPAMTWKTRVILVREVGADRSISYGRRFITERPTRIATLAAGYGDGYQRHLSGRGAEVLIRGKRCPVLGRVTMDQIMVDISRLDRVNVGEEAILAGSQGNETILASELAKKAGTITWEIFTAITKRVERVYR
ncbi:MAG TPA: alanine racemase [Chthoniobacterales bacterium]|nr:alanine racemase [Chthoniobacterales bacterium]